MVTKLRRLCWPVLFLLTGCSSLGTYFPETPVTPAVPLSVTSAVPTVVTPPEAHQVALLLPAEGGLGNAAQAIEAGFNAAYATVPDKPVVKNYDTTQTASLPALYQQAISEGADRVIGPLNKTEVEQLLSNFHGQTVTIALNSLQNTPSPSPWFYQFGLSPLDEAQQVADKAIADGYRHALLITPAGAWGENIAQVLLQRFQADGGTIVSRTSIGAQMNVNAQIRQLLQANGQARRQDFDVIFMIVQPLLARQIKPLLQYYGAGEMPVYSTSLVFSGLINSRADRDLNGVKFCDMPLVLDQQGEWAQVRQNFSVTAPGNLQTYLRLYGLGWDAALVTQQFAQLTSGGISGATGYLYVNAQHHILRKLSWAIFRDGVPTPIN